MGKNIFLQAYQQMNESQQDEVGRTPGRLPWQIDQAQQSGQDQQPLQPTGHQDLDQDQQSGQGDEDISQAFKEIKKADADDFAKKTVEALNAVSSKAFSFKGFSSDLVENKIYVFETSSPIRGVNGGLTLQVRVRPNHKDGQQDQGEVEDAEVQVGMLYKSDYVWGCPKRTISGLVPAEVVDQFKYAVEVLSGDILKIK